MKALVILGASAFFVSLIGLVVWYDIYFSQNCLRSHTERHTYYVSHCVAYGKNGCYGTILVPEEGYTTVCDEWKH